MFIHLKTNEGKRILWLPFRKPPISPKTIILSAGLLIIEILLLTKLSFPVYIRFLLGDLLIFPVSFLLVGIMRIPTIVYHKYKIHEARKKLLQHKPMTVIGITGSYGKTSTKEYLGIILGTKYKVLKTEASKNSAIAIAEVILPKLTPDKEIFIVEMGAYKRGEIREITELVKPQIGIITAINAQHQDLFGAIETTMTAKYELIEGLTGKRIAVFNADNSHVVKMAGWAKKSGIDVWSVGKKSENIIDASQYFNISNVRGNLNGITFDLKFNKESASIAAPVLGEHMCVNVALAIAGAIASGLSFKDAVNGATYLKTFSKTMEPMHGTNGALFINDTFNNNPDAANAAIDFLAKTKGRKILVFQPMIELGDFAEVSHENVGEHAAKVCNDIILTNANFLEPFTKGVRNISSTVSLQVLNPGQAASYIRSHTQTGDTVLFKGKEAEQTLRVLIQ